MENEEERGSGKRKTVKKKKWGREERGGIVGMREREKLAEKLISVTSIERIISKWAP